MKDIITIGEILIDLTQTGYNTSGIRSFAANPGGAPANCAVAAAKLGANVGFVGKIGSDSFGQDLTEALRSNGVDVSTLYSCTAPTTMAVVSVDKRGERSFCFYRNATADTLLTTEETISALDPLPKIVHIGSVSLTAEPERSATLAAAEYAKKHRALVSYDPNYRAALWPDEASAVEQMKLPLQWADIIKVSDEELPLLTGTADLEEGSRILASQGAFLVLITLGEKGTFYRSPKYTGTVAGFQIAVADTNGAGDTFLGALLSQLVRVHSDDLQDLTKGSLEEYIRFANLAASVTCSRSGAIPAMPTLADLNQN